MKKALFVSLVLGLLLVSMLAGCGPAPAPSITVESGWGRPSATMPTAGGIFPAG